MTMNYNYSFIVTKLNSFSEFHIALCFGRSNFSEVRLFISLGVLPFDLIFHFLWASCLETFDSDAF